MMDGNRKLKIPHEGDWTLRRIAVLAQHFWPTARTSNAWDHMVNDKRARNEHLHRQFWPHGQYIKITATLLALRVGFQPYPRQLLRRGYHVLGREQQDASDTNVLHLCPILRNTKR